MSKLANAPWAIDRSWVAPLHAIAQRHGSVERAEQKRIEREQHLDAIFTKPTERYNNARYTQRRDNVGILSLVGPIYRYASMFDDVSAVTSIQRASVEFVNLTNDDTIDTIVLLMDSPGGQVDGTHDFAELVAKCPKKTAAYIDGMGCSAAYWIASACDEIWLSTTARVGSIGVIMSGYTHDDEMWIMTDSDAPLKDVDPENEDSKASLQKELNTLASIFRANVAANRAISDDDIKALRGGVLIGAEAVPMLADQVGQLEDLLDTLTTPEDESMAMNISPAALQSALVGGTPEASAALLDELKQANNIEVLRADYESKIADLSGKLEAMATRLAALEGEAPQGNHWSGGFVASQAQTNQPAQGLNTQPQVGGISADFLNFLTAGGQ